MARFSVGEEVEVWLSEKDYGAHTIKSWNGGVFLITSVEGPDMYRGDMITMPDGKEGMKDAIWYDRQLRPMEPAGPPLVDVWE